MAPQLTYIILAFYKPIVIAAAISCIENNTHPNNSIKIKKDKIKYLNLLKIYTIFFRIATKNAIVMDVIIIIY